MAIPTEKAYEILGLPLGERFIHTYILFYKWPRSMLPSSMKSRFDFETFVLGSRRIEEINFYVLKAILLFSNKK